MLVKQWLRDFLAQHTQNPKEQLKIRTFRDAGVKRWRVFELAAFLPLLLQLALLLFFIGLSEYLRELDPVVGWITTSMILVWLFLFSLTTTAPLIYQQCPYKTPILRPVFSGVRHFVCLSLSRISRFLVTRIDLITAPPTIGHRLWLRLARLADSIRQSEEEGVCAQWSDIAILIYSIDNLRGERVEETILQCSRGYTEEEATRSIGFMAHHLGKSSTPQQTLRLPHFGRDVTLSRVCVNMLNDERSLFWATITGRTFLPTERSFFETFQDLHECITSAASHTWEHSLIEVSRSAFRKLTSYSGESAVLAFLSVYRAMRSRVINTTGRWDPQPFHWTCVPQETDCK